MQADSLSAPVSQALAQGGVAAAMTVLIFAGLWFLIRAAVPLAVLAKEATSNVSSAAEKLHDMAERQDRAIERQEAVAVKLETGAFCRVGPHTSPHTNPQPGSRPRNPTYGDAQ